MIVLSNQERVILHIFVEHKYFILCMTWVLLQCRFGQISTLEPVLREIKYKHILICMYIIFVMETLNNFLFHLRPATEKKFSFSGLSLRSTLVLICGHVSYSSSWVYWCQEQGLHMGPLLLTWIINHIHYKALDNYLSIPTAVLLNFGNG